MVTHIVLFKLKGGERESVARQVKEMLEGLRGKVPGLRHLEAGTDVLHSERSYDVGLIARFDSMSDLDAYQVHPEHRKVADYIQGVRESAVAVDFES